MSLRVQKTFGVRSDTSKNEPKRKFIFAFEGEKTEKQYFNSIADCKEYNVDDIIKNKKVSKNGKTFMEKCLTEKLGSYNKKRLKFQPFKHKIDTAIENETIYVEDIQKLKNDIGSSIGVILKEIL